MDSEGQVFFYLTSWILSLSQRCGVVTSCKAKQIFMLTRYKGMDSTIAKFLVHMVLSHGQNHCLFLTCPVKADLNPCFCIINEIITPVIMWVAPQSIHLFVWKKLNEKMHANCTTATEYQCKYQPLTFQSNLSCSQWRHSDLPLLIQDVLKLLPAKKTHISLCVQECFAH